MHFVLESTFLYESIVAVPCYLFNASIPFTSSSLGSTTQINNTALFQSLRIEVVAADTASTHP